jgi:lipoprotein-releasing system permease protein
MLPFIILDHFVLSYRKSIDSMFKPVALFIGLRYMRGRTADRFGQFISWLSLTGITLGVMALVILLSVMNGFERDLENKILGLMPQAIISTPAGFLDPDQIPASVLKALKGVRDIVPLATADVVLQSSQHIATGVMLGITPSQSEPLADWLVHVSQQQLQPGQYAVIMGEKTGESA